MVYIFSLIPGFRHTVRSSTQTHWIVGQLSHAGFGRFALFATHQHKHAANVRAGSQQLLDQHFAHEPGSTGEEHFGPGVELRHRTVITAPTVHTTSTILIRGHRSLEQTNSLALLSTTESSGLVPEVGEYCRIYRFPFTAAASIPQALVKH